MPRRAFGAQVERGEVLEYWANNAVRAVSHEDFRSPTDTSVSPRTVAPGRFSDVCPSPPASPGSWARLCAQCVGLDRAEKRGARRPHGGSGFPMEGRGLPCGVVSLTSGSADSRPNGHYATDALAGRARCSVDGGGLRAAPRTTSAFLVCRSGALSDLVHKKRAMPSTRTTPPCVPNPSGRVRTNFALRGFRKLA